MLVISVLVVLLCGKYNAIGSPVVREIFNLNNFCIDGNFKGHCALCFSSCGKGCTQIIIANISAFAVHTICVAIKIERTDILIGSSYIFKLKFASKLCYYNYIDDVFVACWNYGWNTCRKCLGINCDTVFW